MRLLHWRRAAALTLTALTTAGLGTALSAPPASAAQACESWSGALRYGSTGSGVRELQIRVAGWVASGQIMDVDSSFGAETQTAVKNFQRAYGLTADGVAGPATFSKLRSLTDSDCTPIHFTYAEVSDNCGKGFTGTSTHKANLRRAMWQGESVRHQLGDHPLRVSSGYRDSSCNASVGGSSNSKHMTGEALDLVPQTSATTICKIASQSRYGGWGTILGPGYPNHHDHAHVDINSRIYWDAPNCFTNRTATNDVPPPHVPDV